MAAIYATHTMIIVVARAAVRGAGRRGYTVIPCNVANVMPARCYMMEATVMRMFTALSTSYSKWGLKLRAAGLLAFCSIIVGQTSPTGMVRGLVEDESGAPLANTVVSLRTYAARSILPGSGPSVSVRTDDKGIFVFDSVQPSSYTLTASRAGFLEQSYGAEIGSIQGGTVITVPGSVDPIEVTVTLHREGVISGGVLDDQGERASAVVRLLSRRTEGDPQLSVEVASQTTNAIGEFKFFGIPPGTYYAMAVPRTRVRIQQSDSEKIQEGFVNTFYPNTQSPNSASPIYVTAGVESGPITIRLATVHTVSVQGVIESAESFPADQFPRVLLLSAEDPQISNGINSPIAADGTFEIQSVPPGDYQLVVANMRGGMTVLASERISIGQKDESIAIAAPQRFELPVGLERVRSDDPSGSSVLSARVSLVADAIPFALFSATPSEEDLGVFTGLVPAVYRARVSSIPDGWYVESISWGDVDVLASGLDLRSGVSNDINLVIKLSGPTSRIEGFVSTRGEPAAGVSIAVVPMAENAPPWTYSRVFSDQNGRFALDEVPPGKYQVRQWDDAPEMIGFEVERESAVVESDAAVELDIGTGETATVSITRE